ncbi:MAG: hypothetical protein PHX93_01915 [Candidatus Peribacteraceae bacterium]|jgi:hypothetical protein|nr:hypothetical protein [Candidatus Peribacteraceae bacterium]
MSKQALAALEAAVTAVLQAVGGDLKVLVEKLRTVDAAFDAAVAEAGVGAVRAALRTSVLPHVKVPEILAKVDFASSLVSDHRPFFRTTMEVIAEDADSMDLQQLLSAVGACRRNLGYMSMMAFAELLRSKLAGDQLPAASNLRCKALYELHMAAYQQAEAASGETAQALYQRSKELAEQSAEEARKAGDPCGALFALMNVSGLLLPKMGQWEEGYGLSEQVSFEAEVLAVEAPDDEARKRPLRVAMNAYLHRVDMLTRNGGRKGAVEALLAQLNGNPIYQACREHADVAALVQRAQRYVKV